MLFLWSLVSNTVFHFFFSESLKWKRGHILLPGAGDGTTLSSAWTHCASVPTLGAEGKIQLAEDLHGLHLETVDNQSCISFEELECLYGFLWGLIMTLRASTTASIDMWTSKGLCRSIFFWESCTRTQRTFPCRQGCFLMEKWNICTERTLLN